MAVSDPEYKDRQTFGFLRPVEHNHAGVKLQLISVENKYEICPMGPLASSRCVVTVDDINEDEETVTMNNGKKRITVSFDDWAWMTWKCVNNQRTTNLLFN